MLSSKLEKLLEEFNRKSPLTGEYITLLGDNDYIKNKLEEQGCTIVSRFFPQIIFLEDTNMYEVVRGDFGFEFAKYERKIGTTDSTVVTNIEHKYGDLIKGNTVSFEISVEDYKQLIAYIQSSSESSLKSRQKATTIIDELHDEITKLQDLDAVKLKKQYDDLEKLKLDLDEHVSTLTYLLGDCVHEKEQLINAIKRVLDNKEVTDKSLRYDLLLAELINVINQFTTRTVEVD